MTRLLAPGANLSRSDAYLALNLLPQTASAIARLLTGCGSPEAAIEAACPEETTPAALYEMAAAERAEAARHGYEIRTPADPAYPALLLEIPDPPPVLYIWGDLEPDDEVRVAVVGSRRASRYGLLVAEKLAGDMVDARIAVVSGLARGIDASAHRGALAKGGRTIAVLGSGLLDIYPPEHRDLARDITRAGAVVSEFPLRTPPLSILFPRRNRIISGLSAGVVVVEAAGRSGALGTARMALEQGREVFAVPGSVLSSTSEGTHRWLADGCAHFTRGIEDVLAQLPAVFRERLGLPPDGSPKERADPPPEGSGSVPIERDPSAAAQTLTVPAATPAVGTRTAPAAKPATRRPAPRPSVDAARLPSNPDAGAVLKGLTREDPIPLDDLAERCGLEAPRLFAALSALEIAGLIVRLPGNRIARE